jgi:hypothetical protein
MNDSGNIAIFLVLDGFVCSGSATLAWRDKKIAMYNYIFYIFKLFKTMGEVAGISWLSIDGGTH